MLGDLILGDRFTKQLSLPLQQRLRIVTLLTQLLRFFPQLPIHNRQV